MQRPAGPLVRSLRPRDPEQAHRAATPLELLTDLCFVVAVAQAAAQLHHAFGHGDVVHGMVGYAMAFFAIWWTWLNFTWFASAYDNDDVIYRLLTILQIIGSLVIAAGVPRLFEADLTLGVTGYIIMRIALVVQWLRAARHDRRHQITCRRYAVGIIVVQVFWVTSLFMPPAVVPWAFVIFALLDLSVPVFAERAGQTPWHPHHIAERYGLFFIIVLGEVILSTLTSIQQAFVVEESADHKAPWAVLMVAGAGIGIVFSIWWLYFSRSAARVLGRTRDTSNPYLWGYGHYLIFGATAAIGAGLGARVDFWSHQGHVPELASAALVTVSVAVLLAMLWLLHIRHHDASWRTSVPFGAAIIALLVATFVPYPELIAAAICIILLVVEIKVARLVSAEE
jgi:low temperature requirement protein LtrA